MRQVVESNVAVIPCVDGVTALRARTGAPPGLTVATDAFNRSYECNISEYKRRTADISFLLQAQLDQGPLISMADTVFVDDHAGAVASVDAELLEQGVIKAVEVFGEVLEGKGMTANTTKGYTLAAPCGPGARSATVRMAASDSIRARITARYLGPDLHWGGSAHHEVRKRVVAAWGVWSMYRKLWGAPQMEKLARRVFNSAVVSTLTSGLSAFVLSMRELSVLSKVYYKMLRRLARGRASWEVVTPVGIEKTLPYQ